MIDPCYPGAPLSLPYLQATQTRAQCLSIHNPLIAISKAACLAPPAAFFFDCPCEHGAIKRLF